jgi:pyruvate kinase
LGYWQAFTIKMATKREKPVMVAGQVFHHLTEHAQPTRSEVVHFWTLREQGVSGIVLSDETAIGKNPARALAEIFKLL